MLRTRLLVAVVALLVGLWGPQSPPMPGIPTRAPDTWPGP